MHRGLRSRPDCLKALEQLGQFKEHYLATYSNREWQEQAVGKIKLFVDVVLRSLPADTTDEAEFVVDQAQKKRKKKRNKKSKKEREGLNQQVTNLRAGRVYQCLSRCVIYPLCLLDLISCAVSMTIVAFVHFTDAW